VLHRRDVRLGEKRGDLVGPTKRGKGTKVMAVADASGFPVGIHAECASPAEVTLVEETLDCGFTEGEPKRLIADKAYDSDELDAKMQKRGIDLIASNRRNRSKTQDGLKLRRSKRR
jgi:hypothetical protein